MTNTVATVETVAANVADEIKAFRSACVTSENRSTPFARTLLASVVSGQRTLALLEAAIIHAFGNPKTPKGKAIAKVSGLRECVGGAAVYQTWKAVVSIVECLDGDAPTLINEGQDDERTVGDGAIRKAVVGFILSDKEAPATLNKLNKYIGEALKAHYALTAPANDDAVADNEEQAKADAAPSPSASLSLKERAEQLLVALQAADDEAVNEAYDAIAAIADALNARIEADADVEEKELEAA